MPTSDPADRIEADFGETPVVTREPVAFDPYRETVRLLGEMVALLERVIDENGAK